MKKAPSFKSSRKNFDTWGRVFCGYGATEHIYVDMRAMPYLEIGIRYQNKLFVAQKNETLCFKQKVSFLYI